ncbi:MAG TPA: iron-sulfur cluster assembly scaffold protein [Patescibacteria group bacterium]
MNDLYQEIILEEAKNPRNKGKIEDADLVLKGVNASCGDQVTIYLKVDAEGKQITDISWEGQGCAISQSAMSVLSEKIKSNQVTVNQIQSLTLTDILELLGLETISPGRIKCVTLGVSTIKKARL